MPTSPENASDSDSEKTDAVSASSDFSIATHTPLNSHPSVLSHPIEEIVTMTDKEDSKTFGTPLQQFVQKLSSVLAKYNVDTKLTDGNFPEWALEIKRILNAIDYHKYLSKLDFKYPGLSDDQHLKVKLVLSIWLLGLMDNQNKTRCQTMMKLRKSRDSDEEDEDKPEDSNDEDDIDYEPSLIWSFLKNHHQKISEAGLQTIEDAISNLKILDSDSFKVHCDKFNNLVADFVKYRGHMSSASAARKLIKTVRSRINENVSENIYSHVVPLTREGVVQYLIEYEARNGGFTTPALIEAGQVSYSSSTARAGGGNRPGFSNLRRTKPKCTAHHCISTTHTPEKCFAKPANHAARDRWIAEMEAKRSGGNGNRPGNSSQTANVNGVKQLTLPSACVSIASTNPFASLHVYLDDEEELTVPSSVTTSASIFEASHTVFDDNTPAANIVNQNNNVWALYDTGATHYMFKDENLFSSSSLIKIDDSSKRLRLAGGDASLAVHSTGKVHLKSGTGKMFELNNCLYVPELAQNLLAGGAMLRKGVQVLVHPKDPNCFSLVFNGEALFNGVFASNNLMYVALKPVSQVHDSTASAIQTEDSALQHRRLGHLST